MTRHRPGSHWSALCGSRATTACRMCCATPARPSIGSDELGQDRRGAGGAVGLDRAVADRAADLRRDSLGQALRLGLVVVQATARAVLAQAVPDVEVLLEMVADRHVEERPLADGEL